MLAVGGAQAVAALAYGTETIPRVDRIVGPGNAYVTAAKLLVSSRVGIDLPAGPSEVDRDRRRDGRSRGCAADLLAQAEHGSEARHCSSAPTRRCPPPWLRLVARYDNIRSRRWARLPRLWRARRRSRPSTSSSTSRPGGSRGGGAQRGLGLHRRLGRRRRLRRRRDARPADGRPRALLRRPRPRDVHEAAAGRAGNGSRVPPRQRGDRADRPGRRPATPRSSRRAARAGGREREHRARRPSGRGPDARSPLPDASLLTRGLRPRPRSPRGTASTPCRC